MSKRDFGEIKSLLHFDYPYYGETGDGLRDEAGGGTWSRIMNARLAGTTGPYDVEHAPKFGWRCANFPDKNSSIASENLSGKFNMDNEKDYEIEAFVNYSSGGSIFRGKYEKAADTNTGYYESHTFRIFRVPKTYETARAICENLGGHLATSTSAEKNAFLVKMAQGSYIWLGGTCDETSGVWSWTTGEEWDYTNFMDSSNGSYVYMRDSGQWEIKTSSYTNCFICEWDDLRRTSPLQYNGKYYFYFGGYGVNFQTARSACKLFNGDLSLSWSEDDDEFFSALSERNEIWLPATDIYEEGEWEHIDGGSLPHTNWESSEPNGGTSDNYAILGGDGKWRDVSGSSYHYFICELSTEQTPNCLSYFHYDGHTFKYFPNNLTWDEAKTACEKLGGHLVTITSEGKRDFISSMAAAATALAPGGIYSGSVWTGGVYDSATGLITWITGEDSDFVDWGSGYPRGYGDYRYIKFSPNFMNESGTYTCAYICEWDSEVGKSENALELGLDCVGHVILFQNGAVLGVSSSSLTVNTWEHVLLRVSGETAKIFLNDKEILSVKISSSQIIPSTILLGGYVGYMDEFCFRSSAGEKSPAVPTEPYKGQLDINKLGGFGTGKDGDTIINGDSVINAYGAITRADTPKTIEINSWSEPDVTVNSKICYGGHTFKLIRNSLTWPEAKAYCENLGGHLATSTSAEKNNFLVKITQGNGAWIGGVKETEDEDFQWITGEEWDYTNWGYSLGGSCSYVYHYGKSGFWGWVSPTDTTPYFFICEWDYEDDKAFNPQPSVDSEVMIHITRSKSNANSEYPYAGLYGFARISGIDGTKIILDDDISTENGYDFTLTNELLENYHVQIITVPNFSSFGINSKITPIKWTATTGGGIVAFRCLEDCTLNGAIITSGYGVARTDLTPIENAKLIDRFLCASGGGVFIACGGTFTAGENARLGATWSGLGDGSNGAAGYGGSSGKFRTYSAAIGRVGGGAGGVRGGTSSQYTAGSAGSGGAGGAGASGTVNGGAGGSISSGDLNGRDGASGTTGTTYGGGGGGGAPGGNGGNGGASYYRSSSYSGTVGGISGSCIILLSSKAKISDSVISTGGASGTDISGTSSHGGSGGGGGTGFCYMAIGELISNE